MAAFVGTLGCGVACAAPLYATSQGFAAQTGLRDAYALRTFGRIPSQEQLFATPVGIQSPLYGLAFVMYRSVPNAAEATVAMPLPAVPQIALTFTRVFSINNAVARYNDGPPLAAAQTVAAASNAGSPPAKPLFARTNRATATSAFGGITALDGTPPSFDSRLLDDSTAVSMPLRAGTIASSAEEQVDAQFADQRTQQDRLLADTTFTPHIAGYPIHLNFGTSYAYLSNGHGDDTALPSASTTGLDSNTAAYLPGGTASLASSLANVTARGVNAGVAVPIAHNLSVGMQYGTQRFTGEYSPSFEPQLDASRYQYLGNVTLKLPRSSSLTLSAQQYRYQDNLTPTNTYSGTRADLNYTVKF
jgi:hypothetical protein